RIVLTRDQQCCDLEPHTGFGFQVLERLEHRRQRSATDLVVEALGESLEINIGSVHVAIKLGTWLGTHVTGGDRYALDATLATCMRGIYRVLQEYDGIVVGECDAGPPEPLGRLGELCGARAVGEFVHLARLRHVPILAKSTG